MSQNPNRGPCDMIIHLETARCRHIITKDWEKIFASRVCVFESKDQLQKILLYVP